jgi:peptidoglycan/LPS O-acetylase OafA/YrhL
VAVRRAATAIDVGAVVLFVAIGRASHHHGETPAGFLSTVWPFAVGLAAGWLATVRRPPASAATGAVVTVVTVVVGMVLRVVAGQGTAAAFIGVTTGFLGACMVGGRLLLTAGGRRLALRRSR